MKKVVKHTEIELEGVLFSTLGSIKSIKDEMLDLEKKMTAADRNERIQLQVWLNKKSKELNDLSDSVVLKNKEAWAKFSDLTQLCKSEGSDPRLLEPIHALCKRIEVIAADLLCFSLGH